MTNTVNRLTEALRGRYDIERELGTGGMATVYLARDVRHERDVAIKVLHPELGAALGSDRFLAEIRTTAKLQHPHILPLLDSGEADGLLYYVMPFVTGETLRQRLEREEQLPVNSAVSIAREVADALSAAHELGIVHRDIKPENILLRGNHALVADFGIALAVQQAGGTRMTQTGLSLGTPQYMSPEQAMGERTIGPRSDIYSLGAVTYEMLAGDPPFTGHSVQAIVAKVMTELPVPLSTLRGTIPLHVEEAVLTALSKLPADRFATAHEFATALGDESRSTTLRTTTRSAPVKFRDRLRDPFLLGLAAGVVFLSVLSGVLAMRPSSRGDDQVTRVAVAVPSAQQIVPQWRGSNVALSADGSRLAYIGAGPTRNTVQVWIRRLDALDATPVPGTVGMTTVRFSPDGRSILVSPIDDPNNDGTGIVVSLDGGARTEFQGAASGGIGPSGRVYHAAADSQTVFIIRSSPGGARDTVKIPSLSRNVTGRGFSRAPLSLTVFPDESAVLVSVHGDSLGVFANTEIVAVSLSSGQPTVIGKGVYGQYLSSGHLLYVSATGDLFVAPFDARTFRITGKATSVGRAALSANAGQIWPQVTASENGTLVYIAGELHRQRLVWLDQQGRVLERLASEGNFWGIALSPDGARVALSVRQDDRLKDGHAGGTGDIFVEDTRTGARTQLTSSYLNMRPSWSDDGQHVLFARVGSAAVQSLVERRADATAPERLVLSRQSFNNTVGDGRWLPGRRALIVRTYTTQATGSRDIFHFTTNGRDTTVTPIVATRAEEHSPEPSPNGALIAYVSNETGTMEVYVQPVSGGTGRLRVSNGGGGSARWSRDGRLYYWDNRNRLMVVSIQSRPSLAVLGVREIGGDIVPSMASPGSNFGFDVAPDGRILVTENVPDTYSVVLVRNWLSEIER